MHLISEFLADYTRLKSQKSRLTAIRRFLSFMFPDMRVPMKEGGRVDIGGLEPWAEKYFSSVKAGERDHVNDLKRFKNSLEDLAPMSQHNYFVGAVLFLERNKIILQPDERRRIRRGSPPHQAITADAALTRESIQKILNFSPPQMKALIMVLASSGCRLGEALAIGVSDVDLQADPATVHIPKHLSKNKLPRITYLTSEAAAVLKEWLKYREEYIGKKMGPAIYKTKKEDLRLFPVNVSAVSDMFILSCQKAGLHQADRNTGKATIHLHSFRKWFRSNLVKAGGNAIDMVEILMGHAGYLSRSYVRIPHEDIAIFYKENEHHLFVYPGISDKDRQDMKNLAEQNKALKEELNAMKGIMATFVPQFGHAAVPIYNHTK